MKNILSIFLLSMAVNVFAQAPPPPPPGPPSPPDPPKKEKVEAMRIAFITQKLDLSPEEAQKFWPVYNEFQKKREELQKKHRQENKSAKDNIDSLSDKQVEALVDGEMVFRQKNLDLEKEYHSKFKSVLPIKKVARLYKAEEQFTRRLLEEISGKGKDGHGGKNKGMSPPPVPQDMNEIH
jgi:hypothetical protein